MTPKEKAQDLYNKYRSLEVNGKGQIKKAALIAVNEIIRNNKEFVRTDSDMHNDEGLDADLEYWEKVKSELKQL